MPDPKDITYTYRQFSRCSPDYFDGIVLNSSLEMFKEKRKKYSTFIKTLLQISFSF